MSNKKDGHLDFRKVKNTQFDSAQTARLEFSELQSAKRVLPTNAILRDGYTHFTQVLDGSDRPTQVNYYQATKPAQDKLTFVADSGTNLAGTYFVLTSPLSKRTSAFYYVVDGSGSAPGIADDEYAVVISANDPAAVVRLSTQPIVEAVDDFNIIRPPSILSDFFTIEYHDFGEAPAINLGSTGFSTTRTQDGDSIDVAEVTLEYDVDNNLIWQGQTLKGAVFDPYSASFNFPVKSALTDESGTPYSPSNPLHVQLSDGSVNIGTVNADLDVQLDHTGATPDSVQIGDGTETLSINTDNEALVHDLDTHTALSGLNTDLNNQFDESQVKQDTIIGELQDIEADLESINTDLNTQADETQTALTTLNTSVNTKSDEIITAIDRRPSQVPNRIRLTGYTSNTEMTGTAITLKTVTPGTDLYVTSFTLSLLNFDLAHGSFGIYDGDTLIMPFIVPNRESAFSPAGNIVVSPSLPEPIKFSDSLKILDLAGELTVSFSYIGYEDIATYQNVSSMLFDGTNEYVDLSNPASLNLTYNVSVTAWFNSTATLSKTIIGKYGSTTADRSYFIELMNTGAIRVYLFGSNTQAKDYRTTTTGFNDGNWHNVTFTFVAETLTVYVDGQAQAVTKVADGTINSIQTNSSNTYIGALPLTGGATNYFDGNIDEVAMISTTLTSSQVLELYNGGSAADLSSLSFGDKLISWYRMGDGDTFPTISDVADGNDGTATNMESSDIVGSVP